MQRRAHAPRINAAAFSALHRSGAKTQRPHQLLPFLFSEAGDLLTQTAQSLVNPLTLSYMCLPDMKLSFKCSVEPRVIACYMKDGRVFPLGYFLALCWRRVDIMTGGNECNEAAKGLDENASCMRKCKSDTGYSSLSLDGALSLLAVLLQAKH